MGWMPLSHAGVFGPAGSAALVWPPARAGASSARTIQTSIMAQSSVANRERLLCIFSQRPAIRFRGIDITGCIHRDAFGRIRNRRIQSRIWNERRHGAVFGAGHPDAALVPCHALAACLGVGDVHIVFRVDEQSGGPAEMLPLGDKSSVLVEDLDAA